MIVGFDTLVPALYREVPPPEEVSATLPSGSTRKRSSFHATSRATASSETALGLVAPS